MIIDMHAHSKGISRCCQLTYKENIDIAKNVGIDAIILTNHYARAYLKFYDNVEELVGCYHNEYKEAKSYGESVGVKVYYGVEITLTDDIRVHLLAYGVDESFLSAHPYVFDYPLKKIQKTVHEYGGILVQAHPFRCGDKLVDTDYLDGVEISCHPKYFTTSQADVKKVAKEKDVIITCGADYHGDTPYRPICGLVVDELPKDINAIVKILTSSNKKTLLIHEVNAEKPEQFSY
ncbi:MAG: PHP domain-containing protein [Clostridia bacterium]|nr:PHP domain-containing protein [Clostridia bacterium]